MRKNSSHHDHRLQDIRSGVTLMECVLALAMIAFTLPVVMLAFSQSHADARESALHGQARRVILQHANELSRRGFPADRDQLAWAHAAAGDCLGTIDEAAYRNGVRRMGDRAVRYLVAASFDPAVSPEPNLLRLTLEHPAAAPAAKRERIEFHTFLSP